MNRPGIQFLTLHFIIYALIQNVHGADWTYDGDHGPPLWAENNPACDGDSQSPVDITRTNVLISPDLTMLELPGYGQTLDGGKLINNGHTVQLNFPSDKNFTLQGGGMGDNKYRALQLHFHWAATGSKDGSEHTVTKQHYPVEMHIVHIKEPYTSVDQVKDMSDGLAVLGVFLDVGEDANPAYRSLLKKVELCRFKGCNVSLNTGPTVISLLPDSASYYRYSGSLTTPPCYQTVTWTVFQNPVYISQSQLEQLQSLKSETMSDIFKEALNSSNAHTDNELGGNYRPTQPLNGRIVTSYRDTAFLKTEKAHDWTYHDPHTGTHYWYQAYPICGKDTQSPINIDSSSSESLANGAGSPVPVKPLVFDGYDQLLTGEFTNNGHAVQLNIENDPTYAIKEGGLKDEYTALQLHFHWGEIESERSMLKGGSEHTFDNKRFSTEMHIVHAKTAYLSSSSEFQQNSPDFYAVLGVFIDIYDNATNSDDGANENMQKLIDVIHNVTFADDISVLKVGPSLSSLLPHSKSFYRYNGSLTTPPCYESVIWTIFQEPVTISYNQFVAFQRLFDTERKYEVEKQSIKLTREAMLEDSVLSPLPNMTNNATSSVLDGIKHSTVLPLNETEKHLLRLNYRPLQNVNDRVIYYYDETRTPTGDSVEATGPPIALIVIVGIISVIILIILVVVVVKCCRKKKGYTAARRADEGALTL